MANPKTAAERVCSLFLLLYDDPTIKRTSARAPGPDQASVRATLALATLREILADERASR